MSVGNPTLRIDIVPLQGGRRDKASPHGEYETQGLHALDLDLSVLRRLPAPCSPIWSYRETVCFRNT